MKTKQWMLACTISLFSSMSFAVQPTDQAIHKLMQVMNLDQLLQKTMQQIRPQLDQQAYSIVQNIVKHEQLTPQEQIVANQLADKMYEQSKKTVSWQEMQPIYQKIYKDVYNAEEIQAQIEFYSSPIGQSILNKAPQVAQESMKIMNSRLISSMQNSEQDFKEINAQLEALKKAAQSNN
ncbi:DUF2059 domain-containing protein [Acinetobacter sp. ANC 4648]|uniref:DUF2059 domain-containing protein n=1 Tax=Acinetobacter sp. ANC 4648 TaxID=1977875 RepID=UPI000A3407AF|nr:DUF2059 domain-containing protein [Acinetobacter sp. ANC 4648]OTG83998.1 hypothetical protein B9T27_05735 [Acinetobacter sp. ANC 4648]